MYPLYIIGAPLQAVLQHDAFHQDATAGFEGNLTCPGFQDRVSMPRMTCVPGPLPAVVDCATHHCERISEAFPTACASNDSACHFMPFVAL